MSRFLREVIPAIPPSNTQRVLRFVIWRSVVLDERIAKQVKARKRKSELGGAQ